MTAPIAGCVVRAAVAYAVLAWASGVTTAKADECNPPKPGWNDAQVEATFDAGVSEVESARNATSDPARVESARLAEGHFRAVAARYPCLPLNVVNLAESLELQGRYLEAKEQYDRLLSSRVTLSKTVLWRESVATAEKAAEALAARIPEIIFRQEAGDCMASSVTVASTRQKPSIPRRVDFDVWFPIDPGEYSVTATSGKCRDFRSAVVVGPGERREFGVKLTKVEPKPPPPITEGGSPAGKCLGMPTWACYVGGGLLAAGAITATALLLSKPAEGTQQQQQYSCVAKSATMLGCSFLQ